MNTFDQKYLNMTENDRCFFFLEQVYPARLIV